MSNNINDYGQPLTPFRYWCQSVIPLVYDETLTQYELLCKVVKYINELVDDDNKLVQDMTQLNNYVNHYFDNLDVQNEINHKLDVMSQDGSLTNLIKNYVDPIQNAFETTINSSISNQNSKITVLENRMNTFASLPDGSTTGDAELTDIRVPADGFNNDQTYATAGDAVRGQITELDTKISKVIYERSETFKTNGYINQNGNVTVDAQFAYTPQYVLLPDGTTELPDMPISIYGNSGIAFYNSNRELIHQINGNNASQYGVQPTTGFTSKRTIPVPVNAKYMRFTIMANYSQINNYHYTVVTNKSFNQSIIDINNIIGESTFTWNYDVISGMFINGRGVTEASNQFKCTNFIPIYNSKINANYIKAKLTLYGSAGIAFYDKNKTLIYQINGNNCGNYGLTATGGLNGDRIIDVPNNAEYTRISLYDTGINSVQVNINYKNNIKEIAKNLLYEDEINWYSGKKITTQGDSITANNMFQPYLDEYFGVNCINVGIGGTTVGGTSNNAMWQDSRVNQIPTDTEVLLLLGGSNDWSNNIPIGNITDTGTNTFYGAYKNMLDKIYTRVPNAKVLLMVQPFRANMYANGLGFVLEDYREATRKIAKLYGYPLIDLLESGINQLNYLTYMQDVVHQNTLGGKKLAEIIIGKMNSVMHL